MSDESLLDEDELAVFTALRKRGIQREHAVAPHPEVLPRIALTALHEAVLETYLEWERHKRMPRSRRRRQNQGDRFTLVDYALTAFPRAGIPKGATAKDMGEWRRQAQAMIQSCGYYAGSLGPPGTMSRAESIIEVMDVIERRTWYREGRLFHYDRDTSPDQLSKPTWDCLAARAREVVQDHSRFLKILHLADYDQERGYPARAVGGYTKREVEQAEAEARTLLRKRVGGTGACDPHSYPPNRGLR